MIGQQDVENLWGHKSQTEMYKELRKMFRKEIKNAGKEWKTIVKVPLTYNYGKFSTVHTAWRGLEDKYKKKVELEWYEGKFGDCPDYYIWRIRKKNLLKR